MKVDEYHFIFKKKNWNAFLFYSFYIRLIIRNRRKLSAKTYVTIFIKRNEEDLYNEKIYILGKMTNHNEKKNYRNIQIFLKNTQIMNNKIDRKVFNVKTAVWLVNNVVFLLFISQ